MLGQAGKNSIAAAERAVVHVLPVPATSGISPFSLKESGRLIDEAAQLTRTWLQRYGVVADAAG